VPFEELKRSRLLVKIREKMKTKTITGKEICLGAGAWMPIRLR
jgi:hypothetical protein